MPLHVRQYSLIVSDMRVLLLVPALVMIQSSVPSKGLPKGMPTAVKVSLPCSFCKVLTFIKFFVRLTVLNSLNSFAHLFSGS